MSGVSTHTAKQYLIPIKTHPTIAGCGIYKIVFLSPVSYLSEILECESLFHKLSSCFLASVCHSCFFVFPLVLNLSIFPLLHDSCSTMIFWIFLSLTGFLQKRIRIYLMVTLWIGDLFLWKSSSLCLHLNACLHQVNPRSLSFFF